MSPNPLVTEAAEAQRTELLREESEHLVLNTMARFIAVVRTGAVTYVGALIIGCDTNAAREVTVLTCGVAYFETDAVDRLSDQINRLCLAIRGKVGK